MKRIGFVDDQLDNFHANTYLALMRNQLQDRGWTVTACTSLNHAQGKLWAEKKEVPYFTDLQAMNGQVDAYMILAPSTPSTHWDMCQSIFPFGKPTYVDKTFAPDETTAKAIFELADRHQVIVQTSSALRYTNVQDIVRQQQRPPQQMIAWGSGTSFGEYAIHPVEMIVSLMGPQATALMRTGTPERSQLLIRFSQDRLAIANVYINSQTPFAASLSDKKGTQYVPVEAGHIFRNTMAAILDMFDQQRVDIDRQESLMVRRILDVAAEPTCLDQWVPL